MNVAKFSLVPFQQASLCLDCEMITAAHTHCFVCGSAALLNLARTLNGAESIAHTPGDFTAAAHVSVQQDFEPQFARSTRYLRPRRIFRGHGMATLDVSAEAAERQYEDRKSQTVPGFASTIHRVIALAIVAVLVGGVAKLPGQYFTWLRSASAHDLWPFSVRNS
jgi:hypothetical protein